MWFPVSLLLQTRRQEMKWRRRCFFVKKSRKWGVFCKKWTFPQHRVHYVQYQYFFILHFNYWGGVLTHPRTPCLGACIVTISLSSPFLTYEHLFPPNFKRSCDPLYTRMLQNLNTHIVVFITINLQTKFEMSSAHRGLKIQKWVTWPWPRPFMVD